MPDFYLTIAEQSDETIDAVAAGMAVRAAEPEMQKIARDYMSASGVPAGSRILEIGCGAGATTRLILDNLEPSALVGIDPSPGLIEKAGDYLSDDPRVRVRLGEADKTGAEDASFDVVLAHTVYSHLADPEAALAEAFRALRPGGQLLIFDGDYATTTVALYKDDPLDNLIDALRRNMVHAPYIMRQLPALVETAGFHEIEARPHGYLQTKDPVYLLNLLSRAAATSQKIGEIGHDLAAGFVAEAERRVADGTFYGTILFVSLTARKPVN